MKANYHTHTWRCGHAAQDADEAYVLAAIAQGYDELGFSDHVPWPYASGFVNPHVRMTMDMLDDYIASIRALQRKYAGQISLRLGFECEHFPAYMNWLAEMKEAKRLDYLILGNHYDESDETGIYFARLRTAAELRRYVDSTVKGVESGLFAYLAHPDLFMRSRRPFDADRVAAARDLCAACKAYNLPMEYNVHDRYLSQSLNKDGYPHPRFFEIALEEGVDVIVGIDAHEPQELSDPTQWNQAAQDLAPFGARHIDRLRFAK